MCWRDRDLLESSGTEVLVGTIFFSLLFYLAGPALVGTDSDILTPSNYCTSTTYLALIFPCRFTSPNTPTPPWRTPPKCPLSATTVGNLGWYWHQPQELLLWGGQQHTRTSARDTAGPSHTRVIPSCECACRLCSQASHPAILGPTLHTSMPAAVMTRPCTQPCWGTTCISASPYEL